MNKPKYGAEEYWKNEVKDIIGESNKKSKQKHTDARILCLIKKYKKEGFIFDDTQDPPKVQCPVCGKLLNVLGFGTHYFFHSEKEKKSEEKIVLSTNYISELNKIPAEIIELIDAEKLKEWIIKKRGENEN